MPVTKYDVLIKNGLIVDGSGKPSFKGDIAVKDELIINIGDVKGDADRIIDADGLVICPGFIDAHTHADRTLPLYPNADNYVMQGVTTLVTGSCGNSIAPILDWWPPYMRWDLDILTELKPLKYDDTWSVKELLRVDEVKVKVKDFYNVDIIWGLFKDFLSCLEKEGISLNFVPFIGHNTVRAQVMYPDWDRGPTHAEFEKMKWLINEAMEAGAFGLSTGLDFVPGRYAKTAEIIELLKIVKKFDGIYATHYRYYGTCNKRAREGILEAIEICRHTGVKTQLSHLRSVYNIFPKPPIELSKAVIQSSLKLIDDARDQGLDICFDVGPRAQNTGIWTTIYLASILIPWLRETGSRKNLSKALRMEDFREEIKLFILSGKLRGLNPLINSNWDNEIKIAQCLNKKFLDKTIRQISENLKTDSFESLFQILIIDSDTIIMRTIENNDEEKAELIKHPYCMIGLDTQAFDDKWELKTPPYFLPHSNSYGGMSRYIRRYSREMKMLTLEEAIRKITYLPAKAFKIKNRGLLKLGAYADIFIFDFNLISDVEDPIDPRHYPMGTHYVFVNGELVVDKRGHKKTKPGRILKLNEE